ncbi:MAG: c-type cytochrome [Thalassotalea sp.]
MNNKIIKLLLNKRQLLGANIALLITLIFSSSVFAADIASGKKLFENTCAGCHGKDLSGGAGFNLKDEEWIHGDKPRDIINNIKRGFTNIGMPAFEGVYTDQQIADIAAYVLSKRQGFTNLTYKIYEITKEGPQDFSELPHLEVSKSGTLNQNLMRFTMPEISDYIIEFEGTLHTPSDEITSIFALLNGQVTEVEIDGELIKPFSTQYKSWGYRLKQGKQRVKILYITRGTRKKNRHNLQMWVADKNLEQKYFGITEIAKNILSKAKLELKTTTDELAVRKKIAKLSAYSIAVGSPLKINYAFNTRSCSVTGLWSGDLLDLGPNLIGRGKDASIILGTFAFNSPDELTPTELVAEKTDKTQRTSCNFIKYNRQGHTSFHYQIGSQVYAVQGLPIDNTKLALNYTLLKGQNMPLNLTLPTSDKLVISAKQGTILNGQYSMDAKVGETYQILLTIVGAK